MAKKKKRSPAKKKVEPKKNSGFWLIVSAIILIIAGVVLTFGAFISAPIPKGFWDGAWWALGIATVLVPVCLIYLGGLKLFSIVSLNRSVWPQTKRRRGRRRPR
jgi:hypothetical protein